MTDFGSHGHVNRRVDGQRARCGGPALCSVCATERCDHCGLFGTAAVQAHTREELIALGAIPAEGN